MPLFRQGDSRAFSYFFELYYRPLVSFAANLVGDARQAEDIVKDQYVKLWQKREDFETESNIKSFLYISTRNASLNYLRHLQVRVASFRELRYLDAQRGEQLVLNEMIRSELLGRIYEAIERLPDRRRQVFKMAYVEGLKNEEIASSLDISVHTVKEHKGKALQELRMKFGDKDLVLFLFYLGSLASAVVSKN